MQRPLYDELKACENELLKLKIDLLTEPINNEAKNKGCELISKFEILLKNIQNVCEKRGRY